MAGIFPNGLMPAIRNNSNALLQGGLGLLSGPTAQQQAALGAAGFAGARQQNKTMQYLQAQFPELAGYVQAGMPVNDALKMAMEYKLKAQLPGSGTSYSKSPIYGMNDKGETVLGTIGDDGSFKQIDTGGFKVTDGLDKIDTGTEIITRDRRTGQVIGVTPKQNFQESFDKAAGTKAGGAQGEAAGSYASMTSKLPGLMQTMDKLRDLAKTATYTWAGQGRDAVARQFGVTTEGALARTEYEAVVNNQILPLLRDTFGAQFTEREGRTLKETLGDPNKSPEEKQAVIDAFIEQKIRDIQAMGAQAGIGSAPPASGAPAPADPLGLR